MADFCAGADTRAVGGGIAGGPFLVTGDSYVPFTPSAQFISGDRCRFRVGGPRRCTDTTYGAGPVPNIRVKPIVANVVDVS